MSKWPWPDMLNRMVSLLPSFLQRKASSIAQRTAWFASGAGRRLDRKDAALAAAPQLQAEEGQGKAGEVRPAASAADDDVGIVAGHFELLDRFLPDDGLMQEHVIEHGAERIFNRRVLGRHLDRFRDRDAERAGIVGVLGQDGAAALGLVRGRGDAARSV